jgi:hypothetical protein
MLASGMVSPRCTNDEFRLILSVFVSYNTGKVPAAMDWVWLPREVGLYGIVDETSPRFEEIGDLLDLSKGTQKRSTDWQASSREDWGGHRQWHHELTMWETLLCAVERMPTGDGRR